MFDPRSSPRSGLSSQASLLVVLGGGVAVFLLFVLPRLTATRAAESRSRRTTSAQAEPRVSEETQVRPAALMVPAAEPPDPATETSVSAVESGLDSTVEKAAPPKPAVVGPKLKYERRDGKAEVFEPEALRVERREQRRQRLARQAEKAEAFGLENPGGPATREPARGRGGSERSRSGGKQGTEERGKGRDQKRTKPQDG